MVGLAWSLEQPDLGMGTTLANFQSVGNMPVVMDLSERLLDILEAVAFSILVETPLAPVAFVESREWMKSRLDRLTAATICQNSRVTLINNSISECGTDVAVL